MKIICIATFFVLVLLANKSFRLELVFMSDHNDDKYGVQQQQLATNTSVPRPSSSPNSDGRTLASQTIRTETKAVSEDGMTETTITKFITDHFSDGTQSSRRETLTTREEQLYPDDVVDNYSSRTSVSPIPRVISGSMSRDEPVRPDTLFIDDALKCHNKYRTLHNVPPLHLSKELSKGAQSWAEKLAQQGTMENSHFGYGENIYWSSSPALSMKGDVPVEYWYHEMSYFDWAKMDFQKNTGSFTQVVWKDSKQFGIAKASGIKGTYVVAFYLPPGNVIGKFKENVFKASGKPYILDHPGHP